MGDCNVGVKRRDLQGQIVLFPHCVLILSDRVQDTLPPQKKAPWHMEYIKLKMSEEQKMQEELSDLSQLT